MDAKRAFSAVTFLIALFVAATPGQAATINYALTGAVGSLFSVSLPPDDPFIQQVLFLTDSGTGLTQLPGVTISVGDTISGQLSLDGPLTVPSSVAGAAVMLVFDALPDGASVTYTESVSFLDGGIPVEPPAGFQNFISSGGALTMGEVAADSTPSFSFDTILFSATIDGLLQSGNNVSQLTLTASSPALELLTEPAPVPVPAAVWLLVSGLGGLSTLLRRRSRSEP